jgi:hypothetical protein
MVNEVGWFGYYCNYCDLFTWMGQYEHDTGKVIRCRRCRYDVRAHTKWLTHEQFLELGNGNHTLSEMRNLGLYV